MEELPRRKNIRLKDFDYAQAGYYFITICTKERKNLFWPVGAICDRLDCEPQLSPIGEIINSEISKISQIYENVRIDKYVIMPNHVHMIIVLNDTGRRPKVAPTISRIVQQFKGVISKQAGFSIWQKSYYDHIIRTEQEYMEIYEYIEMNPLQWQLDQYYSE